MKKQSPKISSRLRVDGVPLDCTAALAGADNPGTPAATNCGGLILALWLSDMVLTIGLNRLLHKQSHDGGVLSMVAFDVKGCLDTKVDS